MQGLILCQRVKKRDLRNSALNIRLHSHMAIPNTAALDKSSFSALNYENLIELNKKCAMGYAVPYYPDCVKITVHGF